jgi:hypothetical protein
MRTCRHCNFNLDGELILDFFIKQGKSKEEALETAKLYQGWEEFGEQNRWKLEIGIYDINLDRTTHSICPNCRNTI